MISLETAKKAPSLFRRLTGLSVEAFDDLMETLKKPILPLKSIA